MKDGTVGAIPGISVNASKQLLMNRADESKEQEGTPSFLQSTRPQGPHQALQGPSKVISVTEFQKSE